MTCPKCQGEMRSYERNGITVDQCTECRGVFLDRGELEHLIEGERSFNHAPTAPQYDEQRGYGEYHYHGRSYKKRKKHFLEELFD